MSLLMDALKRAEASKQQQSGSGEASTPPELAGLSLEPVGSENGEKATPLPDLASHLDAVDADLEASASLAANSARPTTPSTPPPAFAAPDPGREAARAMFAAKIPEPAPSRTGLWLVLGVLGLCGVGIGIYFWLQLSQLNAPSAGRPLNSSPSLQITRTTSAPPVAIPSVPVPKPSATVLERSETAAAPPESIARAASANALSRGRPADADATPTEPTIPNARVQLSRSRPTGDPLVLRAWSNLQAGKLDAAFRDYEQTLRNDPKNVDALMGLAVIAQREGRPTDAERFFQLALEADPKNAAAQAAVIGNNAPSDPSSAESRLKTALGDQPDSPSLNFALGNLYARQQRWPEAQQAYFNAVAGDGDNPDYLFNLAVSLDQLRQAKPATQYYQKALEAGAKRPAAFDRERASRRLGQLTATP